MNTEGFGGRSLSKATSIETNDKTNPNRTLIITGQVGSFAKIDPRRVSLNGTTEQELNAKVTIVPDPKYAFKVIEVKAEKGENIRVKLQKSENGAATAYVIDVDNTKTSAGRYTDKIIVKTDSTMRPEIQIDVYGNLFEPPKKKPS